MCISAFYMGRAGSPPLRAPWGRWRAEGPHGALCLSAISLSGPKI